MKINYNFEDVFNIIKDSLVLRTPFLAMRYGDGEAILLENKDRNLIKHIFERQLGAILEQNDIDIIRNNLIETLNKADLLGIPTKWHLTTGGYWSPSIDILNGNCSVSARKFGSIDFHHEFLRNWDTKASCYDLLLNNLSELYTISCRNLSGGFYKRFNISKIESIDIPPEMMFENKTFTGLPHYPDRFLEIKNKIQAMGSLNGKLLLYGAGFVGKIYGLFWKNQGGVAVGIGSVFDYLAGNKTRGGGCGATAIDLTYKS